MAIEKNSGLKAYEMDVKASEADVKISNSEFLPSLKLRGHYTLLDKSDRIIIPRDSFLSGIPLEDVELSAENREVYGANLSIHQPIFTGKKLTHSFLKSKILKEETLHNFEKQKKVLAFEVKKAFYDERKEQLYKKILEEVIKSKKENLRVLKERHKEGYIQSEDVIIAETDLSSIELDLFKTRNRVAYALSRLKKLIDYQGEDEIVLQDEQFNKYITVSLQQAKEFALQHREDIKVSLTKNRVAQEDIKIAMSKFYPEISVEGRYTIQKETNVTRPDFWMFITQIDWPIFEWNKTRSEVKKAEASEQKQKYIHEELKKSIMMDVEESWRTVKDMEKEVEVKEKQLRTAEYIYKQSAVKYSERIIRLSDFLNVESEFIRAYNEYLMAINKLNIAIAQFEVSTSGMLEEWSHVKNIYEPEFKLVTEKGNALYTKNKRRQFKKEEERNVIAEVDTNPIIKKQDIDERINNISFDTQTQISSHRSCYAIQVGAFKSKRQAENLRKHLHKKISDKRIIIVSQTGFYKVRIAGFKDKIDAHSYKDMDINGFVIRTDCKD